MNSPTIRKHLYHKAPCSSTTSRNGTGRRKTCTPKCMTSTPANHSSENLYIGNRQRISAGLYWLPWKSCNKAEEGSACSHLRTMWLGLERTERATDLLSVNYYFCLKLKPTQWVKCCSTFRDTNVFIALLQGSRMPFTPTLPCASQASVQLMFMLLHPL